MKLFYINITNACTESGVQLDGHKTDGELVQHIINSVKFKPDC